MVLTPTRVGIAQAGSSPASYEAVRTLVAEAVIHALGPDGFANLVQPDDQVFIKINGNFWATPGGNAYGYLTDPRVVRAVAELLTEIVTGEQIKVGEGISHGDSIHFTEFQQAGFDTNLDGYLDGVPGVRMVCLNEPHDPAIGAGPQYVTRFDNAPGHQANTWFLPNVIANADVRISVPVLKTHNEAGLTAAMKNSVGHLPCDIYYSGGYRRDWEVRSPIHQSYPRGPAAAIADINAVVPYHFVVIDALTAQRYGPWISGPDCIYPRAVVAGRDAVAVDTVLAAIIGWDATCIDYLVYGQNDGIGVLDPGYIRVRGLSVQALRSDLAARFPGKIPFPEGYGNGINGTRGSCLAEMEPPWVSVTEPAPGATIHGPTTIRFTCGDNTGVVRVELRVDGVPVGDLAHPGGSGVFQWNADFVEPGPHTLTVVVFDAAFSEAAQSVEVAVPAGSGPTFSVW